MWAGVFLFVLLFGVRGFCQGGSLLVCSSTIALCYWKSWSALSVPDRLCSGACSPEGT